MSILWNLGGFGSVMLNSTNPSLSSSIVRRLRLRHFISLPLCSNPTETFGLFAAVVYGNKTLLAKKGKSQSVVQKSSWVKSS